MKILQPFILMIYTVFVNVCPAHSNTVESSHNRDSITIKINSNVWPCFPNHYFSNLRTINLFSFPNGTSVEVTEDAAFLSDNELQKKCISIYDAKIAPIRSVGVFAAVDFANANQSPQAREIWIDLEEFVSYAIAFEIWEHIFELSVMSSNLREAYFIAANLIEFTHRNASICERNASIRNLYPTVCDYSHFQKMMSTALKKYDEVIATDIELLLGSGAYSHTSDAISKQQKNFLLETSA